METIILRCPALWKKSIKLSSTLVMQYCTMSTVYGRFVQRPSTTPSPSLLWPNQWAGLFNDQVPPPLPHYHGRINRPVCSTTKYHPLSLIAMAESMIYALFGHSLCQHEAFLWTYMFYVNIQVHLSILK